MDWNGKKERARIAALHDPRESEEWFQNLSDGMRAEMTRQWRSEQERWLEVHMRARDRNLMMASQFGLLLMLTDALMASLTTPLACFMQFGAGFLIGLALIRMRAGQMTAIPFASFGFIVIQVLTRGGLVAQNMFTWIFVAAGAAYLGMRLESHE